MLTATFRFCFWLYSQFQLNKKKNFYFNSSTLKLCSSITKSICIILSYAYLNVKKNHIFFRVYNINQIEYKCDFKNPVYPNGITSFCICIMNFQLIANLSNMFFILFLLLLFFCFCFANQRIQLCQNLKPEAHINFKFLFPIKTFFFTQFLFSGTLCGGHCCGNESEEELTIKSTNNFYRLLRHHTRSLRNILESTANTFKGENAKFDLMLEFQSVTKDLGVR